MESRIIVALQNMSERDTFRMAEKCAGHCWGFKIKGMIISPYLISELKQFGKVMVDPKLFDTPMDMTDEISSYIHAGADIITVHMNALYNPEENKVTDFKNYLAGVTILTTFTEEMCKSVYMEEVKHMVYYFSCRIKEYGYKYSVCSAQDLKDEFIEDVLKDVKKICPGIRPIWSILKEDDQKRTTTPAQAIELGADYLVIGKPIIKAKNPREALIKTNKEVEEALAKCQSIKEDFDNLKDLRF